MTEVFSEQEQIVRILKGWQFDRDEHGSLFDRGRADSYYGRRRNPHYGGVGGNSGDRIIARRQDEIDEYLAGYEHNECYGDKKDYQ